MAGLSDVVKDLEKRFKKVDLMQCNGLESEIGIFTATKSVILADTLTAFSEFLDIYERYKNISKDKLSQRVTLYYLSLVDLAHNSHGTPDEMSAIEPQLKQITAYINGLTKEIKTICDEYPALKRNAKRPETRFISLLYEYILNNGNGMSRLDMPKNYPNHNPREFRATLSGNGLKEVWISAYECQIHPGYTVSIIPARASERERITFSCTEEEVIITSIGRLSARSDQQILNILPILNKTLYK
ncbi:MAG: hypothetical protein ABIJ34_05385 [archaeon]